MYKHKHYQKNITENTCKKDLVIKQILSLGLGDYSTIEKIGINCNYNYNQIVEVLLFSKIDNA